MNIGILTAYLALGDDADSGIGQHYRILADALCAQGHRVHVMYCVDDAEKTRAALSELNPPWSCDVISAKPPAWLTRLFERSWPLKVLLDNLWMAQAASKALAAACRQKKLAVIETHAFKAPALFFLLRRSRPPVVTRVSTTTLQTIAISTMHSRMLHWQASLEIAATRNSDARVTHTRQHRDTICALENYPAASFAIVPHGLPDPGSPFSETEGNNGSVEFLFVGRFEERKGIDVLLKAIPIVAASQPNARFTLAGSMGDASCWNQFASDHPDLIAQSRVQALGRVSSKDLPMLYHRCDILVAPSRYESFGLIYAEAMSHAKPVIGCDTGGIPEVVTSGLTGLLAVPGDCDSLVESMLRLASDPTLRIQMGTAGRLDFLRRFDDRTLALNSVDLYKHIVSSSNSLTT